MDNPLSKVALDYWYQVVMVAGICIFILAGSGILKAYPLAPTALTSIGFFWIGLGEWINHPLQTILVGESASHPSGMITGHPRNPRPLGMAFVALGVALIAFGAYKFLA